MIPIIQAVVREQLGASVTYGVATFPDQAITFEELVHQAELDLQRQNGNGRI